MNRILLVLTLLLIHCNLYAQEKTFVINGNVSGKPDLKYALFYDGNDDFVEKCLIKDGKFTFTGKYSSYSPEGRLGSATIFLTEQYTGKDYVAMIRSKALYRELILEPVIDLTFDATRRKTNVKAGALNEIQNIFFSNNELYANKRDSVSLALQSENLDTESKAEKKRQMNLMLFTEEKAQTLDIIKRYPSSEVALFNFMPFTISPTFKDGRVRVVFDSLSDSIKHSLYGRRLDAFLAELDLAMTKPAMIYKIMPSFQLAGVEGDTLQSKNLMGKYTLIDFWASWCVPCRAENPSIVAAFEKYHGKGFNVIAISIDQLQDKEKWLAAIKKDKSQNFSHLFNPGGKSGIAKELKINSIPANYLIDSTGKIIAVDLRGTDLAQKLKELIP